MANIVESFLSGFDTFLAWAGTSLKQTTASYCDIQTADSPTVLVAHDGSLMSIIQVSGVKSLIGREEFDRIHSGLQQSLQTSLSQPGHAIQVYFNYDKELVRDDIRNIFAPAHDTAQRLNLSLEDLFQERLEFLSHYCAHEEVYLVLWTHLSSLTREQLKRAQKDKRKALKDSKAPIFSQTQNILAAVPELRESHDSFVRLVNGDFESWGLVSRVLEVHEAIYCMRRSIDPDFTDEKWSPVLPGDKVTPKEYNNTKGNIADLLWPELAKQIIITRLKWRMRFYSLLFGFRFSTGKIIKAKSSFPSYLEHGFRFFI